VAGPLPPSITSDRAADIAALKGKDPRIGAVHPPAGLHRVGVGGHLPRTESGVEQRGADPPGAATGLGVTTRPTGQGAADLEEIQQDFNSSQSARRGLAGRPDRAGRVPAVWRQRRRRPASHHGPSRRGRTDASQEQTGRRAFAVLEPRPTGSATTSGPERSWSRRSCCWNGPTC